MERVPPEIHLEICEHLPLEDLPHHRLVNNAFAAIGRVRLFRQFVFHASNASFNRLISVAAHPIIRKLVKTLVWDANLWDFKVRTFEQWKEYLTEGEWMIHRTNKTDEHIAKLLGVLAVETFRGGKYEGAVHHELRRQWMVYHQNLREESQVLDHCLDVATLQELFYQLDNVEEIKVVNGLFRLHNGAIVKEWEHPGEPKIPYPLGLDLLARGEGIGWKDLSNGPPGQLALERSILTAGERLKTISVNHLSWVSFTTSGISDTLSNGCASITSLELVFTTFEGYNDWNWRNCVNESRSTMKMGFLKRFLGGFKNLQCLSLSFPYCHDDDGIYWGTAACLGDVIPPGFTRVRSLTLQSFDSSEDFFTTFLLNNASTLTSISLEDMYLMPPGSWVRIFNTLKSRCNLKSAGLSGILCDSVNAHADFSPRGIEDSWDLDSDALGHALEVYLVSGGPCPLKHNLKIGVQWGNMDPVAK